MKEIKNRLNKTAEARELGGGVGGDNHPEKMCMLSSLSNLTVTTSTSSGSYKMCLVLSEDHFSKANFRAHKGHIFISLP